MAKGKHIAPLLLFLGMIAPSAFALETISFSFSDAELQSDKHLAICAINSPGAWGRFPKAEHASHYTVDRRKIDYLFHPDRPNEVTIVLPTTKTTPRHQCYVAVTFDHFGRLIRMNESFFL